MSIGPIRFHGYFWELRLPGLAIVILLLTLPGIGLSKLMRSRWRAGCCSRCSYDLTGNTSGVCPECGTAVVRKSSDLQVVLPLLLTLMLLTVSGCGTIVSIISNEPFPIIVYGGLQNELHPVSVHSFFDIPFSAVADTAMLPYTIPQSIHNQQHPEERPLSE